MKVCTSPRLLLAANFASAVHSKNNSMKFIPKEYDFHPNEFHTYGMN